jgi:hypothetical protein
VVSQVLLRAEACSRGVGDPAVAAEKLLEAVVGAAIFGLRVRGAEDANHVHHPVRGPGIRHHH